jgi:hypothetical protein
MTTVFKQEMIKSEFHTPNNKIKSRIKHFNLLFLALLFAVSG